MNKLIKIGTDCSGIEAQKISNNIFNSMLNKYISDANQIIQSSLGIVNKNSKLKRLHQKFRNRPRIIDIHPATYLIDLHN